MFPTGMRKLLVTVGAAAVGAGITAAAAPGHPPAPHRHCLSTPQGYVEIAPGVVEHAPHDPAFHNVHGNVHVGAGLQGPLEIIPVFNLAQGCP